MMRRHPFCPWCGGRLALENATIDHVIPLARGGTNYEGNLVPCCKSCNSSKQDRLPIEFMLWLKARGGGVNSSAA